MVKNKKNWNQLSLKERADFIVSNIHNNSLEDIINIYACGGKVKKLQDVVRKVNSFGDGGNTNKNNKNETANTQISVQDTERNITLQEYLKAKADSTRLAAYDSSLRRKTGIRIPYPLTEEERLNNEAKIAKYSPIVDTSFVGPLSEWAALERKAHMKIYKRVVGQAIEENKNNCDYGYNCIGTATDNYPEDSRTVVNTDFRDNHSKYGFVKVPFEEVLPGDVIMNSRYNHALIFNGFTDNNIPTFNYSKGGITPEDYVVNGRYPSDEYHSYRYVGTPEIIQQWTDAYNENYSSNIVENKPNTNANGGKLNIFKTGGKTHLGTPYASSYSSNYDYFNASSKNIPEGDEHWTSRNPITGQILKSENHPTFNLALDIEGVMGNNVYKSNIDGKYYSYAPNELVPFGMELVNGINQPAIPLDPVRRFEGIKTTNNRPYVPENISLISDRLDRTSLGKQQKNAILSSIIEESGGRPLVTRPDGKHQGLLQWENSRYEINPNNSESEEMDSQLAYMMETLYNTSDKQSWTDGGKGSGYKTAKQAQKTFMSTKDPYKAVHSLNRSYVRPPEGNAPVANRYKVAKQIERKIK